MIKLKIIYVQLLLSEQSRVRSIDVLRNGTTPNIMNGNGWIHVKVPQPQHYELDCPKSQPIGHVFPPNLCHDPTNYYNVIHQSGTEDVEWVVHIQIVAVPY